MLNGILYQPPQTGAPLLRHRRARRNPGQPRASTQRPAYLLSQRPLQLSADGNTHCLLYYRATDYHRPTDTVEKIDFGEMQVAAQTVAAVSWALANREGRPELNTHLPDQLVRDMKSAKEQGWGKITPVLAPLPGMPY